MCIACIVCVMWAVGVVCSIAYKVWVLCEAWAVGVVYVMLCAVWEV